jgi:hypothetical protein
MNDPALAKALAILAEAQVRVEYKLDAFMSAFGLSSGTFPQLGFVGQLCPLCKKMVEYQIDIEAQIVKRACGCKTGKQPSFIPLIPVTPEGEEDGRAADAAGGSAAGPEASEDRPRRKDR